MEVHHPHHPFHKKKWTEYLLEFFMLFLAVFLGFIAENLRERSIEKERAVQLSSSLVVDLNKDSAQLDALYQFRLERQGKIDSFYEMLLQDPHTVDRRSFYNKAKSIQGSLFFVPATGTTNELKSAGYLRYFINTKLATMLAENEAITTDCGMDEKIEYNLIYDQYYTALRKALDPASFDSLFNKPAMIHGTGIAPIAPTELDALKKAVSQLKYQNYVFIHPRGQFSKLREKEREMINYMNERYAE